MKVESSYAPVGENEKTRTFFLVYVLAKTEFQRNEATVHRRAMLFAGFVVDICEGVRLQRIMGFGVMDACKRYVGIRNQG